MSLALEIKNVSFAYSNQLILDNVSLSIDAGHFVGIIGPNAGGKTTFFKLLLGLLDPLEGKIRLLGKKPKVFAHIGYVPQFNQLDPKFPITVKELILLGAVRDEGWCYSYSKKIQEKANELMEMFGLTRHQDKRYSDLSGGFKQRALFAKSLMVEPQILILDEPTANMDRPSKKKFFDLLCQFKGNKTILMVDHDIDNLSKYATKLLLVDNTISEITQESICHHQQVGSYHTDEALQHG